MHRFDVDELVSECRAALQEAKPALAVKEVVERAVADPATARAFTPDRSEFNVLHRADDLTVLHIGLAPSLGSVPHDHRMWAVVGIIDGQEDNTFFRRAPDELVTSGGRSLQNRDVLVMGDDTIHAIRNPKTHYVSALHVYGGDLIGAERSEWDRAGKVEQAYDHVRFTRVFDSVRAEEDRLGRSLVADEVQHVVSAIRG
jgi:predicted metal-dependent enzyme (double-stranded beta helix superfamily)